MEMFADKVENVLVGLAGERLGRGKEDEVVGEHNLERDEENEKHR